MRVSRVFGSAIAVSAISVSAMIVSLATPLASAVPPSGSSSGSSSSGDFYLPPSPLPDGAPGDVIRAEPSNLAISIPTIGGGFPAVSTRIMYRSTDSHDNPVAVTGTYLDPALAWTGPGERPLVSLAVGTHGQGDQCAPSKQLNSLITYTPPLGVMVEYEVLAIYRLLAKGIAVVVTDYQGLGTPGVHTYVNRVDEGNAVLDAAKAAQKLSGTTIPANGPVGLFGYSQGGGAVAAATELASGYAPELTIVGTYAGAPPADLAATLAQIDGSLLSGLIGYTLNGLIQSNPELVPTIDDNINERGRQVLAQVANQCVPETVLTTGLQRTSQWTKSGQPLASILGDLPVAQKVLAENKIGKLTPTGPVLVQSGTSDDIVPHGQAVELAADWCAKGATVQLDSQGLPPIIPGSGAGHLLPNLLGAGEAVSWIADRFAGVPAPSNCA